MHDDPKTAAAKLRAAFVKATPGATETDAAELFADICTAWHIEPDKFPRLVEVLEEQSGLSPALVIATLHGMSRFERSEAGGELLFAMGLRTARRRGVMPNLLEQLVAFEEARGETSH